MNKENTKDESIQALQNNITDVFGIPSVKSDRNYWMIRTNGGNYYGDFSTNLYIAIAWDYITLSMLNTEDEDRIKRLIESSEKANPSTAFDTDDDEELASKGKVTSIYNKLHRFVFDLSIGDIVLVPNKNSEKIMIAEIAGNPYEDNSYIEKYLNDSPDTELSLCPYSKRRKIKPLKTISKSTMDIYLSKGFNSQHALSSLNEYSSFIDRTLYPIYSKGSELHSTIHAGHPNGLSLRDLSLFIQSLEKSIDNISEQCGIEATANDIDVKLNFHSPGLIELIGYTTAAGIPIALITFALNNLINGGTFRVSFKRADSSLDFSIESTTDGIMGSKRKDKELELKEKDTYLQLIKDLDIKSPDLIANIINGEKITADQIATGTASESNSPKKTKKKMK